jgi:hypothetical protein
MRRNKGRVVGSQTAVSTLVEIHVGDRSGLGHMTIACCQGNQIETLRVGATSYV